MKDKRDFQNYWREAELKISVLTLFHFLTTYDMNFEIAHIINLNNLLLLSYSKPNS